MGEKHDGKWELGWIRFRGNDALIEIAGWEWIARPREVILDGSSSLAPSQKQSINLVETCGG